MYLTSPKTLFSRIIICGSGQIRTDVYRRFYGCRYGFTDNAEIYAPFTDFKSFLYGYGIQSLLLCVLSIELSAATVPIATYSVASNLYAVLPIALTIVHFHGTSILSLHNINFLCKSESYSHLFTAYTQTIPRIIECTTL